MWVYLHDKMSVAAGERFSRRVQVDVSNPGLCCFFFFVCYFQFIFVGAMYLLVVL